jgi:DinB superfamily
MHAVLQQVFDSYGAELSGKPAGWCQLHPRQDERLWSAQELIEHLVLTCRSTSRVLDKRIERGRPTSDHSTPIQWLLQMVVLSFARMPRGAPAPVFARPDQLHWPPMNGAELIDLLRQEIDQMDALLDRSRQHFGLQRVATHFILGPLRTDQWRRFHVIHMRHHLGQLRRIAASVGQAAAPETHSQPAWR